MAVPNKMMTVPTNMMGKPINTERPNAILSTMRTSKILPKMRPPNTGNWAKPYSKLLKPSSSIKITGERAIHSIKGRLIMGKDRVKPKKRRLAYTCLNSPKMSLTGIWAATGGLSGILLLRPNQLKKAKNAMPIKPQCHDTWLIKNAPNMGPSKGASKEMLAIKAITLMASRSSKVSWMAA